MVKVIVFQLNGIKFESMWKELGFKESPFNTKPLEIKAEDIPLLIGRKKDALKLLTALEVDSQGVCVLSGVPGVGKTSFINVQQYLVESKRKRRGPHLLSARQICPIHPGASRDQIALEAVSSLCYSIESFCIASGKSIPSETHKVKNWLSQKGKGSFSIGLSILGFGGNVGRSVNIPPVDAVTFQGLVNIIRVLVSEIIKELHFDGCFIVLDNIENLKSSELGDFLISFRDTFFSIKNVWWILIGQSGLGSLIQSIDPRVSQRINTCLEINPISFDALLNAVNTRVNHFKISDEIRVCPISNNILAKLYEVSNGEIRFVLKYCQDICIRYSQTVLTNMFEIIERQEIDEKGSYENFFEDSSVYKKVFKMASMKYFDEYQIREFCSWDFLREIAVEEFRGFSFSPEEREVLRKIGHMGSTASKDYEVFSVSSRQKFSGQFLIKNHNRNLLYKWQDKNETKYKLKGIAMLAFEFSLFDENDNLA